MDKKTKLYLASGIVGCWLFIIVFLIEGATRVGYSSFRYPISSLSIGDLGWIQIINFILSGTLIFLLALGLRLALKPSKSSIWIPRLIGAVGLGLIGAGIFSTDPAFGYPATSPLAIAQFTVHGHLHDLFSIFVFACLPIACFEFRKRFKANGNRGWSIYSLISAIAFIITFLLAGIGFKQITGFIEFAGIFQRLCIIIGFTWMTMIALFLIKTTK